MDDNPRQECRDCGKEIERGEGYYTWNSSTHEDGPFCLICAERRGITRKDDKK